MAIRIKMYYFKNKSDYLETDFSTQIEKFSEKKIRIDKKSFFY